jgi:hypothetical protein
MMKHSTHSEPRDLLKSGQGNGPSQSVVLRIQGIGPVPPLKSSKVIWRKKDGTPFIATKPETKKWMRKAILRLLWELKYCAVTIQEGTRTDVYQRCLTALLKHSKDFDDSVQWIPEEHVRYMKCDKENEGAIITITLL